MGRAPCCDKANVKKGPWSPEEDAKLKSYIEQNGTGGNWIALPQKIGLKRCGKSCRLRWLNYLRPNLKHGSFSEEEDNIICSLYLNIGSRWSIIAAQLPGRTDNDIKNYWNTRLKKKLLGKQRKEQQARRASLKQEIKRENQSFIINQQTPYWPELPISSSTTTTTIMPVMTNPSHESHFFDQESLKNLLFKLGGRFSDDNNQESYITNTIYPQDHQQYANSMNSTESSCSQLHNSSNYTVNGAAGMFQGLEGFPVELDELLVYSNNQQQLEGLENFYGASSGESSSGCWGNNVSSSLQASAYPQLVNEFETCLHSLPQEHSSFEVSSYFGTQ